MTGQQPARPLTRLETALAVAGGVLFFAAWIYAVAFLMGAPA